MTPQQRYEAVTFMLNAAVEVPSNFVLMRADSGWLSFVSVRGLVRPYPVPESMMAHIQQIVREADSDPSRIEGAMTPPVQINKQQKEELANDELQQHDPGGTGSDGPSRAVSEQANFWERLESGRYGEDSSSEDGR